MEKRDNELLESIKKVRKLLAWLLVFVILISGVIIFTNYYPHYEYKIKYVEDADVKDYRELNILGNKGWKVVGSRRAVGILEENGYEFVLMKKNFLGTVIH